MGRTARTEPQCLYKSALYIYIYCRIVHVLVLAEFQCYTYGLVKLTMCDRKLQTCCDKGIGAELYAGLTLILLAWRIW